MSEISKEQQEVWDRLNYVPPHPGGLGIDDMDINSIYPQLARAINVVFQIDSVSGDKDSGGMRTIKVLKSR